MSQGLSELFTMKGKERNMVGWRQDYSDIATDPVRVCCFQNSCQDNGHHDAIDSLHRSLAECMRRPGEMVFGRCRKWRQIQGSDEFISKANTTAM